MLTEEEAREALIKGIVDGREETLAEAPYMEKVLGVRPDTDTMGRLPIHVRSMYDPRILGVTNIEDGKATAVAINPSIIKLGKYLGEKYNKSKEWVLDWIYRQTKDTMDHEGKHILTARMSRGEKLDEKSRSVMESVTTYGRKKLAQYLGKHDKARHIEETNPYPLAWALGKAADMFYEGGFPAYLRDSSREPFYRPMGRLAKAAIRKGARNLVPKFAFA